jgi:hypothetical protein
MIASPEVRRPTRPEAGPANFDDWEAWIHSDERASEPNFESPRTDSSPELAVDVDLVAGEFFRGSWRRRLADAQGDCGYVARQMRKAGVPLDLALAILLMPDPSTPTLQTSIVVPVLPPNQDTNRRLDLRFIWTQAGRLPLAKNEPVAVCDG